MAVVRQREEVERELLGEEPSEEPAAEILVGAWSGDAATPIPNEEQIGNRPDKDSKQLEPQIQAQHRRRRTVAHLVSDGLSCEIHTLFLPPRRCI